MQIQPIDEINQLKTLLISSKLPTEDIDNNNISQFYGIFDSNNLIAAIGSEIYHKNALLRSLVVDPKFRGNGLAKALVDFMEDNLKQNNIKSIYLLTTTAESFFLKVGYAIKKRSEAPEEIQSTSQFSDLCPSSSSLMMKSL